MRKNVLWLRVTDTGTDCSESVEFWSSWIKSWAVWTAPIRAYWTRWLLETPFCLNHSLILWLVAVKQWSSKYWVLFASRCPSMIQASFHSSSSSLWTVRQSKYRWNHWGSVADRRGTGEPHPGAAASPRQETWIRCCSPRKSTDWMMTVVQMKR